MSAPYDSIVDRSQRLATELVRCFCSIGNMHMFLHMVDYANLLREASAPPRYSGISSYEVRDDRDAPRTVPRRKQLRSPDGAMARGLGVDQSIALLNEAEQSQLHFMIQQVA